MNTKSNAEAKINFEKDFFKLKNNTFEYIGTGIQFDYK